MKDSGCCSKSAFRFENNFNITGEKGNKEKAIRLDSRYGRHCSSQSCNHSSPSPTVLVKSRHLRNLALVVSLQLTDRITQSVVQTFHASSLKTSLGNVTHGHKVRPEGKRVTKGQSVLEMIEV